MLGCVDVFGLLGDNGRAIVTVAWRIRGEVIRRNEPMGTIIDLTGILGLVDFFVSDLLGLIFGFLSQLFGSIRII